MDTLNTIGVLAALFLVFVLAGGAMAANVESPHVGSSLVQQSVSS